MNNDITTSNHFYCNIMLKMTRLYVQLLQAM